MFDNATVQAVAAIAARLSVEPAALLAVAEVESGGKAFARVNGRNEPLIRWEGHYFDRRLSGTKRAAARKAGLASPKAGGVPNPAKQEDRWKLLNRAAELDAKAAFESASYGVGQVMGSHWQALGFGSVTELVNLCRESVAGQIEVMARFIEKNKLAPALRAKNWPAFARGYNGSGYAKNAYDRKMATAYAKWVKKGIEAKPVPVRDPKEAILKLGSDGPFVSELQTRLLLLGYKPDTDSVFGDRTDLAVRAFQKDKGLEVDGWAGPRTLDAIGQAIAEREAKPKIEAAKKEVPPAVVKEVQQKTNWLTTILTGGGVGSAFVAWLRDADWQTVAIVAGAGLATGVVVLVGGVYIVRRIKAIKAELAR